MAAPPAPMSIAPAAAARLADALRANHTLWKCLHRAAALDLPDWYLGAGCVAQTVWNLAHGKAPEADILDYDLVYFDREQTAERERSVARAARALVADLSIELDVTNQAHVHCWYREHFGYDIPPYGSTEEAIATWPTTATAVGVRPAADGLRVWAPLGLDDLLGLVVRPNRVQITPAIYAAKVARWSARWPRLTVLTWEDGVGAAGQRGLNTGAAPGQADSK